MKSYLQYLVILLDDTSIAYCHADNPLKECNLMPLETLKKAILYGMKENLMIQYVYPEYELPKEYDEVIESIDHIKILPTNRFALSKEKDKSVVVCNSLTGLMIYGKKSKNIVLRQTLHDFIDKTYDIATLLPQVTRLNICLTDIDMFKEEQIEAYKKALNTFNSVLLNLYKSQKQVQVNILTDRLQLTEMHNCEAGIGNITIAPNGKFYLCPAFYYDEKIGLSNRMNHVTKDATRSVGDLDSGLQIPNKQLLQLDHAPLCRNCDAYHCNRCIWLNQKLTWDNNTPSHQQCVVSHIERNATHNLQLKLKEIDIEYPNEIKEIDYLDPFDVKKEW